MKILALGTYPIRRPVHGGQRRTHQIGEYYRANGLEYLHACVYDPRIYGPDAVFQDDLPFGSMPGLYAEAPLIDDLASGAFAATRPAPYAHFVGLVQRYQPDVIQVEQPFMWPLVRRMRRENILRGVKIIYSSHNVEAPLKRELLENSGVERRLISRVEAEIVQIETELALESDLVVSVSQREAHVYQMLNTALKPLVVRNGTERPGKTTKPQYGSQLVDNEYLFFVGSAYPPNIDGYKKYVLSGGLYGFPPQKRFAICGGAADGIYQSDLYAPHHESYQDRVQFFSRPTDNELAWLREHSKALLLPIDSGGGSNLKTAEALSSGKWVIATSTALRSFEDFAGDKGVVIADTPDEFQNAILDVAQAGALNLTSRQLAKRDSLFWDRLLGDSGLVDRVLALGEAENPQAGVRS